MTYPAPPAVLGALEGKQKFKIGARFPDGLPCTQAAVLGFLPCLPTSTPRFGHFLVPSESPLSSLSSGGTGLPAPPLAGRRSALEPRDSYFSTSYLPPSCPRSEPELGKGQRALQQIPRPRPPSGLPCTPWGPRRPRGKEGKDQRPLPDDLPCTPPMAYPAPPVLGALEGKEEKDRRPIPRRPMDPP